MAGITAKKQNKVLEPKLATSTLFDNSNLSSHMEPLPNQPTTMLDNSSPSLSVALQVTFVQAMTNTWKHLQNRTINYQLLRNLWSIYNLMQSPSPASISERRT